MQKTSFLIRQMDCLAEEQMIRMKLDGLDQISSLQFDIPNRQLTVFHAGGADELFSVLQPLQLDTSILESVEVSDAPLSQKQETDRKILIQVLLINAFFFLLEGLTGFLSNSMGLVADGLDMLADSLVYGLALFAIGSSIQRKMQIAKLTGYFQLSLAILGLVEVIRRFLGFGETPSFQTMIVISILALIGNALSLYLLQKSQNEEAHFQALTICTSNDVIVNLGVIVAGVLVYFTQSRIPDLIIGTIVFVLVSRGAYRILKISN